MCIRLSILVLAASLASSLVHAQCRGNEVLVGEDKDNYYCKDRQVYAQCIRDTGIQWKQTRKDCASRVQDIFTNGKKSLSTSALSCVGGCLGNGLTIRGCLSSCGIAAEYPVELLENAVNETDLCLTQALQANNQLQEKCKH